MDTQLKRHLKKIWRNMIYRCTNEKSISYVYYGGRGIKVCSRWKDFEKFYDDMHKTYTPLMTIERIDVNKGYSPDNCRWATKSEQSKNKTNTAYAVFNGQRKKIDEWAELFDMSATTLRYNLKHKLPLNYNYHVSRFGYKPLSLSANVVIRMTKQDKDMLKKIAEKENATISDYIRYCVSKELNINNN